MVTEELATRQLKEIIQIEYSRSGAFPYFGAWDNTPSRDIKILNNTFRNFDIAIGNHYQVPGQVIQNVEIAGNKFENFLYSGSMAVRLYGFDGVVFENNEYGNGKLYENVIINGQETSKNIVIRSAAATEVPAEVPADKTAKLTVEKSEIEAPNTGFVSDLESVIPFVSSGAIIGGLALGLWHRKQSVKF